MKLTLCGSAKFENEYHTWNEVLSMAGHIVYSLIAFPSIKGKQEWYIKEQKEMLDLCHLEKISLSDAIVVINCGMTDWGKQPYVGESTRREIIWARMQGKPAFYTGSCRGDDALFLKWLEAYAWKGVLTDENL